MKLGQTIVEIRKEHGLTQEDLAKEFHVTRQTVSNWENEKSYPDLCTLVKISDTYHISLDDEPPHTRDFSRELGEFSCIL